ncbi:MerR family transcriptional regulator [Endothiovibrio diazotrophicus]
MDATDPRYPIRIVAQLTGVNPVTLRAWERRYGLLRPERTAKGHRLYSAQDVERINRVNALLAGGMAIREAARQVCGTQPVVAETGGAGGGVEDEWGRARERFFAALEAVRPEALDALYNELAALYPPETVSRQLLRPLLAEAAARREEVGGAARERWLRLILRNKLVARLAHGRSEHHAPRFAAVALAGEGEELELLTLCVAAETRGWRPLYLGASLSPATFAPLIAGGDARVLLVRVDRALPRRLIRAELERLEREVSLPVVAVGLEETVGRVVSVGAEEGDALRMLGVLMERSEGA